jgi:hypothetical protein
VPPNRSFATGGLRYGKSAINNVCVIFVALFHTALVFSCGVDVSCIGIGRRDARSNTVRPHYTFMAHATHASFANVCERLTFPQRLRRMRLSMRHIKWCIAIVGILGVFALLSFALGKQWLLQEVPVKHRVVLFPLPFFVPVFILDLSLFHVFLQLHFFHLDSMVASHTVFACRTRGETAM